MNGNRREKHTTEFEINGNKCWPLKISSIAINKNDAGRTKRSHHTRGCSFFHSQHRWLKTAFLEQPNTTGGPPPTYFDSPADSVSFFIIYLKYKWWTKIVWKSHFRLKSAIDFFFPFRMWAHLNAISLRRLSVKFNVKKLYFRAASIHLAFINLCQL